MGLVPSRPFLSHEELFRFRLSSGLSTKQLNSLYTRFCELDRFEDGYLTPSDLLRIPQLALNPMYRQVVDCFFDNPGQDARLGFDKFVEIFAIILRPESGPFGGAKPGRSEKLRFLTQMFDSSHSGCIKRLDFRRTMSYLFKQQGLEDEVAVELMMLEHQAFGSNTRDRISYEEFEQRLLAADIDLTSDKWSWKYYKDECKNEEEIEDIPLGSRDSIMKKLSTTISNYFLSIRDIFYQ
ncbi:calcineurin B homologous protein 1 [Drosophila kikkawai]|uniref:Calcineurin B homologous protein 1 n=1 Tax=Drosophila kikkawai TaxID=30033 RepID=A0ABM3C727_DROKI|nr:calcineurin B homologous protein 1 [Drosophila kikkawai]